MSRTIARRGYNHIFTSNLTYSELLNSILKTASFSSYLLHTETSGIIAANSRYTDLPITFVNETFDTDALWPTKGVGWSIAGGVAASDGSQVANSNLQTSNLVAPAPATVVGKTYQHTWVLQNRSAGLIRLASGGSSIGPQHSTDGTKVEKYIWIDTGGNNRLTFIADSSFIGEIPSLLTEITSDYDARLTGTFTLNQTGLFGVSNAIHVDGTGVGTIYQRTGLNGLSPLWLHMVINPDSLDTGDILAYKSGEYELKVNSALGELSFTVNYSTTNATAISQYTLVDAQWNMVDVFIGNDKVPHIFINGLEGNYATQITGDGTRVSNTNNLQWYRNTSGDGLIGYSDEALITNAIPSASLINRLAKAAWGGNPPSPG